MKQEQKMTVGAYGACVAATTAGLTWGAVATRCPWELTTAIVGTFLAICAYWGWSEFGGNHAGE